MPIPNWILRSMTLPYGARLPHLEEIKHNYYSSHNNYSASSDEFGFYRGPTLVIHGKVVPGNLENREYEFFGGNSYRNSTYATCRWCKASVWTTALRADHFKATECSQKIKRLGALLRRDKKCVVCDAYCNRVMWGLPLCRTECVAEFKFRTGEQHAAYEAAKKLVEAR